MAITATNPTIIQAQSEKIYDKWWLSLGITGDQVANAYVTLRKYRIDENGKNDFSPVDADVEIVLSDVLALATSRAMVNKPLLAQIVTGLLAVATEIGTEQGRI